MHPEDMNKIYTLLRVFVALLIVIFTVRCLSAIFHGVLSAIE
jgi:hypothetical protein